MPGEAGWVLLFFYVIFIQCVNIVDKLFLRKMPGVWLLVLSCATSGSVFFGGARLIVSGRPVRRMRCD